MCGIILGYGKFDFKPVSFLINYRVNVYSFLRWGGYVCGFASLFFSSNFWSAPPWFRLFRLRHTYNTVYTVRMTGQNIVVLGLDNNFVYLFVVFGLY